MGIETNIFHLMSRTKEFRFTMVHGKYILIMFHNFKYELIYITEVRYKILVLEYAMQIIYLGYTQTHKNSEIVLRLENCLRVLVKTVGCTFSFNYALLSLTNFFCIF